jgi:hypothetical protein
VLNSESIVIIPIKGEHLLYSNISAVMIGYGWGNVCYIVNVPPGNFRTSSFKQGACLILFEIRKCLVNINVLRECQIFIFVIKTHYFIYVELYCSQFNIKNNTSVYTTTVPLTTIQCIVTGFKQIFMTPF